MTIFIIIGYLNFFFYYFPFRIHHLKFITLKNCLSQNPNPNPNFSIFVLPPESQILFRLILILIIFYWFPRNPYFFINWILFLFFPPQNPYFY